MGADIHSMQKDVFTFADLQNWRAVTADVTPPVRLSVFGDPVAHSKSPAMHNAALKACGIDAQYARLQITPGELAGAVRLLVANGFLGTNVTIPHKGAMPGLMDEVDEHARKIGTVNTVVIDGGRLRGFNTDGQGIVRAVRDEFCVDLRDLRVMILGAGGGAGRAIAVQCAMENCERLVLVNRTFEKAKSLADELQSYFRGARLVGPVARLEAVPWEEAQLKFQIGHTDLVINATSMGMKLSDPSPLPGSMLMPHLMIYDTIYTAARTPLLRAADETGARSANGLSMLLHQGALSFEIWFNREAPLEVMRNALQQA
jgi:shikimate dehydrogenase